MMRPKDNFEGVMAKPDECGGLSKEKKYCGVGVCALSGKRKFCGFFFFRCMSKQ
jgi:hypothetical protein